MKEVIEVLNRLRDEEILPEYALGGGMAALAYIESFLTENIDVFVIMAQERGLVDPSPIFRRLSELGFTESRGDRIVIGDWPVQFLPPEGELEQEAIRRARTENIEGVPARIFTAEHLMAIALKTGRPKDLARLQQFTEAQSYDSASLDEILNSHGLMPRWRRAREGMNRGDNN